MRRREFLAAVFLAGLPGPSAVAQDNRQSRVGILTPTLSAVDLVRLRSNLVKLGYIEGTSLSLKIMSAQGDFARLPLLAERLDDESLDVLVSINTPASKAMRDRTGKTPVVMAVVSDPVALGLVQSLARPGGRMTGVSNSSQQLASKRLALLKEAAPGLSSVDAFYNPEDPITVSQCHEIEQAGPGFALTVRFWPVRDGVEARAAVEAALPKGMQAAFIVAGSNLPFAPTVAGLALRNRLPSAVTVRDHLDDGGLLSYWPDQDEHWGRVAQQIDRILKGARPQDLPIEVPTRFNLAISLRNAQAIGLILSPSLLAQANEIIE